MTGENNVKEKDINYPPSGGRGRPGGGMGGPGGMGMGGGKAKDTMKSLGQLAAYSRKYLPAVIIALVLAVAGTVLNLIGPNLITDISNYIFYDIATGRDVTVITEITKLSVILVALYGAGFIFNYIQGFIMATVSGRMSQNLRGDISKKINKVPLSYFDKTTYGNVLSRVTNDVDTIGQSMNQSVATLVSAIVMLFGALIMMFVTNWIMALSAIGASVIGFILMMVIMSRSQKYFRSQQSQLGALNGHIEETYSGHTVVKAYNGEKKATEKFNGTNNRLYNSAWKSQFMSGLMMPLMSFVGNLGYVVVCVVGAMLFINKSIDFGIITAFIIYVRLFINPLSQLAQAFTSLQSAAAASERVFEFLGEKELANESAKLKRLDNVKGDVEFKNVRFGYDEGKIIINDFSAKVKAGQKIAIVGPTGAGKTTVVNLLMRFYECGSGDILVDGVPIRQLTRENVHEMFCMVLQDTWLFEGTVRENIVYSKSGVTDEQLEQACKAAGIHHYIHTLPDGYDTVLNDSVSLSAGQRQLMTIARALVDDAPLLILDEATSSVDTRTEALIQQSMDELMKGRTSFVIAHRLSTIKNADMILVMKDGDIIESGNHENLLAAGGFYAELYNSQFETGATAA